MDHWSCTFPAFPNTPNQVSKPSSVRSSQVIHLLSFTVRFESSSSHHTDHGVIPGRATEPHQEGFEFLVSHTHRWLGMLKCMLRTNPGDSMVLSPSPGTWFLPDGRFWWRKDEKLQKLEHQGEGEASFQHDYSSLLLECCENKPKDPFGCLGTYSGWVRSITMLAQYRRTFILTL